MSKPDILAALEPVVDALTDLGVPYMIGGSVASSAVGVARATLDVDLVADLKAHHVAAFVEAIAESYYVSAEAVASAVDRRASFNVIHLATMMKVDVFVLQSRPFELQAFERRIVDTLEDRDAAREFYLAHPLDIILHKLLWYRMGAEVSERQWRDVIGVMEVQADRLDRAYLEHWADQLGVSDLLERALTHAGLHDEPS
jgi:hypothetical protein